MVEDFLPPQVEKLVKEFRVAGWLMLAVAMGTLAALTFPDWYLLIRTGATEKGTFNFLLLDLAYPLVCLVIPAAFIVEATLIKKGWKWARTLGIVLAVLLLPLFPCGTAFSCVWFYRFSTAEARQYFRWCR